MGVSVNSRGNWLAETTGSLWPQVLEWVPLVVAGAATLFVWGWLDRCWRQRGYERLTTVLGLASPRPIVLTTVLTALVLGTSWHWQDIPGGEQVRLVACVLAFVVAWKAATEDFDLAVERADTAERWITPLVAALVWWSPSLLIAVLALLSYPLNAWRHHSALPLRVLAIVLAYSAVSSVAPLFFGEKTDSRCFVDQQLLLFLLVTVQVSHYFATAIAKARLGPHWYSWVPDNRLHHLMASSYSWGWARFVPWPQFLKGVNTVKKLEKPMQMLTFAFELLSPLALIEPSFALALCAFASLFHVGVLVASGIFFWEWIFANAGIGYLLLTLQRDAPSAFGWHALVVGLLLMLIFPARGKLWIPVPLGWWDTPFTQRVYWKVIGKSGKTYGLYNNFLCPHERQYGRVHGLFMVQDKLVTYHLGEVWRPALRDALHSAGANLEALNNVKSEWGVSLYEPWMIDQHKAFLKRYFGRLNAGARKRVLPAGLSWLKPLGGQFYYWGNLPPFTGQERASCVEAWYREEYFDGEAIQTLTDRRLLDVPIAILPADAPIAAEVSESEVERMLGTRVNGKLLDLPSWAFDALPDNNAATRQAGSFNEAPGAEAGPAATRSTTLSDDLQAGDNAKGD